MPMIQGHAADVLVVAAAVDPDNIAGTQTSAYVPARTCHGWLAVGQFGTTGGSCQLSVMQAQDSSGTGAKSIGSATLVLTDDVQQVVSVMAADLDAAGGFTHLAVRVNATGTNDNSGLLLGWVPRTDPASVQASTVDEVVRVG